MARAHTSAIRVTGRLEAVRPLHVGGMADSVETDMPLARDGRGRLYVPGTSLAGALRSWMSERFEEGLIRRFWGYQQKEEGEASRCFVEDALVDSSCREEIWDGVGIDREWGAAAEGIKFDRAVLPRGTRLGFRLRLEVPPDSAPQARAMLGHLLNDLMRPEGIPLGAGITRGLGAVKLVGEGLGILEEDWSSRKGILALLEGRLDPLTPDRLCAAAPDLKPRPPEVVDLEVRWEADGPIMVKAGHEGLEVDVLPMVSGRGKDQWCMILPGSSIKGALREHAERIVRTVRGLDPVDQWRSLGSRERHLKQLEVPLVERLFGSPKRKEQGGERGCLEVAPCYLLRPEGKEEQWRNLSEALGEKELREALGLLEGLDRAFHVAVDRWTGGAAEGMLYSAVEPWSFTPEPLRMRVRKDRLGRDYGPAMALLLLVLRDLQEGRLRIGFGVNRGYGEMRVRELVIGGRVSLGEKDDPEEEAWKKAWQAWIDGGKRT